MSQQTRRGRLAECARLRKRPITRVERRRQSECGPVARASGRCEVGSVCRVESDCARGEVDQRHRRLRSPSVGGPRSARAARPYLNPRVKRTTARGNSSGPHLSVWALRSWNRIAPSGPPPVVPDMAKLATRFDNGLGFPSPTLGCERIRDPRVGEDSSRRFDYSGHGMCFCMLAWRSAASCSS